MRKSFFFVLFFAQSHFMTAQPMSPAGETALTHVGHFIFRVPDGWKTAQQGNLFTMTAPSAAPDQMMSFLLLEPVTDTGFVSVGNATLSQLANAMNGEVIPQVSMGHPLYFELYAGHCLKGWDYSYGNGSIRIKVVKDGDPYPSWIAFSVGLYLAQVNGRIERVCYLSKDYKCGNIVTTTTSNSWSNDRVIENFFFNMRFDDWTDATARPGQFNNTGVTGVWSGVSYFEGTYRATIFILFDNGQVCYNTRWPSTGLADLNTMVAAANDPPHWGTYTYKGGSGVIKVLYQTIPFTVQGDKFTGTMNGANRDFKRMPILDEVRLDGTWTMYGGAISITFTPDGRFEDYRVIRELEHRATTCDYSVPERAEGDYSIRNHTVFFHYSDGSRTAMAIAELGLQRGVNSPDQLILSFENNTLTKVKP
jgi:hypothetical protein